MSWLGAGNACGCRVHFQLLVPVLNMQCGQSKFDRHSMIAVAHVTKKVIIGAMTGIAVAVVEVIVADSNIGRPDRSHHDLGGQKVLMRHHRCPVRASAFGRRDGKLTNLAFRY